MSLPTFVLLMAVLMISMGELIHSQMLQIGETMFGDRIKQVQYFALRADPTPPSCRPDVDVDAEAARLLQMRQAGLERDEFDGLINLPQGTEAQLRRSLTSAKALCESQFQAHQELLAHLTPEVRVYRAIEQAFFELFNFGTKSRTTILLALLGLAMLATSVRHDHIALASPRYRRDFWMQSVITLTGSAFLLWSNWMYYRLSASVGGQVDRIEQHLAWVLLFALMLLLSAWRCWKPCARARQAEQGTWRHAIKAAPLGSVMAVVAGLYHALQGHPAGLAIHVHSLMEVPSLSLHLALFIWCGMLFKQSRVVDLFMNLLRPWQLSPEVLAFVILLAAALPTAYTGGSGAFVVAAGAIIYHEVRDAGGSSQFALATSAMSGSLGMVLRPSLLVVAIGAMNRSVTSQELFYWGGWVLALTSTLFLLASLIMRPRLEAPRTHARVREAFPAMVAQIQPLLPHVAVAMAVIGFFSVGLGTRLNETSAPLIMPMIIVLVLLFDKLMLAQGIGPLAPRLAQTMRRERSFEGSVRVATTETVGHLGGYIYLIILSQALGGVVERSGLIGLAPQHFANPTMAMAFLAAALVVLGMFMEPLGAVFLVSSALAPLATANGIDPVHFWIVVLVAFELGYLMPPVALNQLLARQVVGDAVLRQASIQGPACHPSFYRRHEQWILPCGVMIVALALVAFLPLWMQGVPTWLMWAR